MVVCVFVHFSSSTSFFWLLIEPHEFEYVGSAAALFAFDVGFRLRHQFEERIAAFAIAVSRVLGTPSY